MLNSVSSVPEVSSLTAGGPAFQGSGRAFWHWRAPLYDPRPSGELLLLSFFLPVLFVCLLLYSPIQSWLPQSDSQKAWGRFSAASALEPQQQTGTAPGLSNRCTAVSLSWPPLAACCIPSKQSSYMYNSRAPSAGTRLYQDHLTPLKLPQWLLNSSREPFHCTILFWNT